MVNKKGITLTVLSILHFFVDFVCVSILYMCCRELILSTTQIIIAIILYNFFAFLTQPFLGLLIDKIPEEKKERIYKALVVFSFVSIYFAILIFHFITRIFDGDVFFEIRAFLCVPFLGIGNSIFHVVGGKISLLMSKKAMPGGIFVSTGAIGVGLAAFYNYTSFLANNQFDIFYSITLIPAIFVVIFSFLEFDVSDLKYEEETKRTKFAILFVLFLCAAVVIRSFLGTYVKIGINTGWNFIFLLGVFACLGKAIGGIILDLFGPYPLIGISTLVAVVFSLLIIDSPSTEIIYDYNGVAFVFGFNMLMPLTLDWLRKKYPNKEGFAFGLTAALLIPGYFLGSAFKGSGPQKIIIPILCFVTGAMLIALKIYSDRKQKNERND